MKAETSDAFARFEESDEETLNSIDLHLYYSVNTRVLVLVTDVSINKGVKMIELTMRPSKLYATIGMGNASKSFFENSLIQGEVSQKEDYGYSINLGLEDVKGFAKCDPSETALNVGCVYLFSVTSLSDRVIQVELISEHRDKAVKGMSLYQCFMYS